MEQYSSPIGKLVRAVKHLQSLGAVLSEYHASDPLDYKQFHNAGDRSSPVIAIQWRVRRFDPPDSGLAFISGDAIHNMRSALDHVMLLTLARFSDLTPQEERRVFFPIMEREADWDRWAGKHRGMLDDRSFEVIAAAQPWQSGQRAREPLSLLARLANIDKHRRILTHTMSEPDVRVVCEPELELLSLATAAEPIRAGLVLATAKYKRPDGLESLEAEIKISLHEVLELDDGSQAPLNLALFSMFRATFDVVSLLIEPVANDRDRAWVTRVNAERPRMVRDVARSFLPRDDVDRLLAEVAAEVLAELKSTTD